MSIAQMIRTPCVIVRRVDSGEEDELGNSIREPTRTETFCELQQQGASSFRHESDDQVSDTRWVLYLLPEEEVGVADTIEVEDDGEFEVYGEPWVARNARTQRASHIEVAVRRTVAPGETPGGGS
jgi:hypothetical protein